MELIKINKIKSFCIKNLKTIYLILSIAFLLPSIIYWAKYKTIKEYEVNYVFSSIENRWKDMLIYLTIFILWCFAYYLILKYSRKLFKDKKILFRYIIIISIIFIIALPFTSSDIFYYIGVGRIDGGYGQNPYIESIYSFCTNTENTEILKSDTALQKGLENDWAKETVVYGAVWSFISKIVGFLSFGNIDIAVLILKLFCVIAHLLNVYLIYKLASEKKIFALIYGINPFILVEGIANAHNDIFVLTFCLFSIYFCIKKKNIFISVLFLALATSIKYFTILLLPLVIIYYYRKQKLKTRIIACLKYGILFLIFVFILYLPYFYDIEIFKNMLVQQSKISKSLYLYLYAINENLVEKTYKILFLAFAGFYIAYCFYLLFKKKISFRKEIRKIFYFFIAFMFLIITNFQTWYIMWLFILIIWQKAENVRLIIYMANISQISIWIYFLKGNYYFYGIIYVLTFVFLIVLRNLILKYLEVKTLSIKKERGKI